MCKHTVTAEQANALAKYLVADATGTTRSSNESIIRYYLEFHKNWTKEYLPLRNMGFDNFVRAVINGFEVMEGTSESAANDPVEKKTAYDVTLTKAEADALHSALEHYGSPEAIIKLHVTHRNFWTNGRLALNDIPLEKLIKAMYKGYEVEKTAEERIKYYIEEQSKLSWAMQHNATIAARTVLDILDIKIKGVNA